MRDRCGEQKHSGEGARENLNDVSLVSEEREENSGDMRSAGIGG